MEQFQDENNRSDEKNKTIAQVKHYLIPILSVSLAIAVLSGLGYLYFSPSPKPEQVTVAVNDIAAVEFPDESALTVNAAPRTETNETQTDASIPKVVVVEEPALVETKPVETAQSDYSRIEIPETVQATPVNRPKPPVKPQTTPTQTKPRVTKTKQPPKAAADSPARATPRFYIQAGSFSTLANAERARQMLADKNINSIIETRKINDKTWYRVLIGAYASKDEADQFKPKIQAIKGFENAMIRQYY